MITNERQYKITKNQCETLKRALSSIDEEERARQLGSKLLASAEKNTLQSDIEFLESQMKEYEQLSSGSQTTIMVESLSEIPQLLIKARIMQRLSQKELADMVGVKEQQIQRYESDHYRGASLTRVQNIADKLKIKVVKIKATVGDGVSKERRKPLGRRIAG